MLYFQQSIRTQPMDKHLETFTEQCDLTNAQITPQLFGQAGMEHMRRYGERNWSLCGKMYLP